MLHFSPHYLNETVVGFGCGVQSGWWISVDEAGKREMMMLTPAVIRPL